MSTISIVIPCYNEEESIGHFYTAIQTLQQQLPEVTMELIFIDDGSKDGTEQCLTALHARDNRVKYLSFSRNFGKEAAIFAGLRTATGDCVVVMDADLQHPPGAIIEMYHKWQEGYEVVEGIKINRGEESRVHRWFADGFYALLGKMMGIDMKNTSDYKLLDRKVVEVLGQLQERDTFFRALSYWVGFKSTTVHYEVGKRVAGKTKWSYFALLRYAIKNLIAFSFAPLYFITLVGGVIFLMGAGFGIDAVISYARGASAMGYPTLVFLLLLLTGGIMLSLGIVGIYIAKIYEQSKNRPQYIIRRRSE
ncbi:MAG: glycosyltransferase family 2 protein [Lachnospiraceae bacterium]